MKDWFRTKKIGWREFPRNGVVRGLKSRSDWSKKWKSRMDCPPEKAPVKLKRVEIKSDRMPGSEPIWQGNSIDFFSPFKIQNKSFGPPLPRESLLKDLEISGKLFIDFVTILFKSSKLS